MRGVTETTAIATRGSKPKSVEVVQLASNWQPGTSKEKPAGNTISTH